MENNKKAVFFDIDGTIFSPETGVTEKTKEAVRLLKENGIVPVICTGRSRALIFESLLEVGFDDIVAGAGTYVEVGGKTIYKVSMENDRTDKMITAMLENGFFPIAEGHENLYYMEENVSPEYKEVFKMFYNELSDVMKPIIMGQTKAAKVSGQFTPESNTQAMIDLFQDEYAIVDHRGILLEFIPKGYSKALGIEKFLEYTGIKRENTYAFGDSMNDKEMIEYVAHGVAMGNGSEELKALSEYVTKSIDEDGVYYGLKHYGLI